MHNNFSSHYITRIHTVNRVYNSYQGQTIDFGPEDLESCLRPGLFHQLKLHGQHPEMYGDVESVATDYELPDRSHATVLTENLRDSLASGLLFTSVWLRAHPEHQPFSGGNLAEWFNHTFSHIISVETEPLVKRLAENLDKELKELYPYLGNCVDVSQKILPTRTLLLLVAGIVNALMLFTQTL